MSIGTQVRSQVFVRTADPRNEPVAEWLEGNKSRNDYNPEVLTYPSTTVLAAHVNGTTHVYMPVQVVAQLDSMGANPASSVQEVTASLIELIKGARLLAYQGGIRELIFLVRDDNVQAGAEQLGFEELNCKVMRMELK